MPKLKRVEIENVIRDNRTKQNGNDTNDTNVRRIVQSIVPVFMKKRIEERVRKK